MNKKSYPSRAGYRQIRTPVMARPWSWRRRRTQTAQAKSGFAVPSCRKMTNLAKTPYHNHHVVSPVSPPASASFHFWRLPAAYLQNSILQRADSGETSHRVTTVQALFWNFGCMKVSIAIQRLRELKQFRPGLRRSCPHPLASPLANHEAAAEVSHPTSH